MLNCCIERRKSRESATYRDGSTSVNKENSPSDDDDDDEFYECETDSESAARNDATAAMHCDNDGDGDAGGVRDTSVEFADSLPYQADGRLKQCGDLQLLHVNECLYVPITQEPAPMTEDMLEEHAEVLARYLTCMSTRRRTRLIE